MSKIVLLSLALVATLAAAASSTKPAEAALCSYRCICSVPYKCCGTTCTPAPDGPLQCPQVYNC
jgi:hypothetical protein